MKTLFIDIDGTILEHKGNLHRMLTEKPRVLDGVIEKFLRWRAYGHFIVLTTARPEGTRQKTEKQLLKCGIFFDKLIMGLNTGPRVLINDRKPDGTNTAIAICLERDKGLGDVCV
jgi:histidinol phosphatase-like enzyme